MIRKLLCFFGFHAWEPYVIYPNIDKRIKGRRCRHCGYDFTMAHWRD